MTAHVEIPEQDKPTKHEDGKSKTDDKKRPKRAKETIDDAVLVRAETIYHEVLEKVCTTGYISSSNFEWIPDKTFSYSVEKGGC